MFKVFSDHKLLYPVPVTTESESPLSGFPWVQPSDFLKTMAEFNDLSHILGGFSNISEASQLLDTFWDRYRKVYPDFELFKDLRGRSLSQCIPLYIHGDEGVTYKRHGVLIMSFQSPLGFGTSKRPQEMSLNLQNMGEAGLPMNFLKCGMYTRMLMVCCPKDTRVTVLCLMMLYLFKNILHAGLIYSCSFSLNQRVNSLSCVCFFARSQFLDVILLDLPDRICIKMTHEFGMQS